MSTVLYKSPVYGPVRSRRLGLSLGINLLPADGKRCTFDCIYCECGFNADRIPTLPFPSREEVCRTLESTLSRMAERGTRLDDLSFAGNGEPTLHPHFAEIVEETVRLRDRYCPQATVSVMSNATFIHRDTVRKALMLTDNNILKLDTVDPLFIGRVDRPVIKRYDVEQVTDDMKKFYGHVIIQTMFLKGRDTDGKELSNLGDEYVSPWLSAVKEIGPQSVMVYTIDRSTPDRMLRKASHEELDAICHRVQALGIDCSAAY